MCKKLCDSPCKFALVYKIVSQPDANVHDWIFNYLHGYIYRRCMFICKWISVQFVVQSIIRYIFRTSSLTNWKKVVWLTCISIIQLVASPRKVSKHVWYTINSTDVHEYTNNVHIFLSSKQHIIGNQWMIIMSSIRRIYENYDQLYSQCINLIEMNSMCDTSYMIMMNEIWIGEQIA